MQHYLDKTLIAHAARQAGSFGHIRIFRARKTLFLFIEPVSVALLRGPLHFPLVCARKVRKMLLVFVTVGQPRCVIYNPSRCVNIQEVWELILRGTSTAACAQIAFGYVCGVVFGAFGEVVFVQGGRVVVVFVVWFSQYKVKVSDTLAVCD
jgi:hypothetical protein